MLAYRLVRDQEWIRSRSRCPHCATPLAWYDMIPLVSWCVLRGLCRTCHAPISALYPLIELLTASVMTALFVYMPARYFASYFIFISALIVTIRSDLETMLISRFTTLFLLPLGVILSFVHLLPISPVDSMAGALIGYLFLYSLSSLFYRATGIEGIGQGDLELLACIGAFLGVTGCWLSLVIGSSLGSLLSIMYLATNKTSERLAFKIPFGPFLAFGAIVYVFFQSTLTLWFFGW